jgi:hypothetical protein
MIEALLIGLISGGLSLMLVHWMQFGHILDFIPYRLSPNSNEKEFIAQMEDFGERAQAMTDYYWNHVDGNYFLRMCICEVCLSVYVFASMFLIFGEMSVLNFFAGLSGTYLAVRYAP